MMGDCHCEKDGATGIILFFMIDIGQRATIVHTSCIQHAKNDLSPQKAKGEVIP